MFFFSFSLLCSANTATKITYYYDFWNVHPIIALKTHDLLDYKRFDSETGREFYLISGKVEIKDSVFVNLIKNKIYEIKKTNQPDSSEYMDCRIALIIDSGDVQDTIGIGKRNIEINGVLYSQNIELLILLKYFQPKYYATEIDNDIFKLLKRKAQ